MGILRNFSVWLAAIITGLTAIIVIRALSTRPPPAELELCHINESDYIKLDSPMMDRFQRAVQFQTITWSRQVYSHEQLDALVHFIVATFPVVHQSQLVTWKRIGNYSLLYVLQGSKPHLKPYMLTGHLDVVPAENPEVWENAPFSGSIHDGFIYGRGTMDDKQTVFGILETLEFKLAKGWQPQRTLYVAFGHDEEGSGIDGAGNIGKFLQEQGIKFEFILDEGSMVLHGSVFGTTAPVAMISTSEKGRVAVKLSVTSTGGHASMPLKESAIGILSKAVARLEAHPHDNMFGRGPEVGILMHIAPYVDFTKKIFLANLWIFGPLVSRIMSYSSFTNAVIRTTTAVTLFKAGIKENVLSPYAEAVVDHRIHPAQTVEEVINRDSEIINDDRVRIEIIDRIDPHPMSEYGADSFGFQTIAKSVRQVFGGSDKVIISPSLMIANTDTRHYLSLSRNIYRFTPTFVTIADFSRFHGVNERISIENYQQTINFYCHVMLNADRESLISVQHEDHSADL